MKHVIKITILSLFIGCSKPVSIKDLEGKDGLAVNPKTGQSYTGEAYLDFYDGSIRMKGEYELGLKEGVWKYYLQGREDRFYNITFENGDMISVNYNDDGKSWTGIPIMHKDSVIANGTYLAQTGDSLYNFNLSPEVYVQMINNTSHGELVRWWPNGEIHSIGQYMNGKKHGKFEWWYDSGTLKETRFWNDDKPVGITTQWYENGNKYAEATYNKGALSGKLVWWYEDGQKKEEVNFINGERDGFAYWWYSTGNKKAVADISSGAGKITLFAEDGAYSKRYDVKNDQIFCSSGEIFYSIKKVSTEATLLIGDGTCDCADCSDEPQ